MKKLSITLLLSLCLVTPSSRASDQACTDDQENRCVLHQHHEWQTPLIQPEFTEEKICASNYVYIELLRTTATDESWEQMCDIVDQVIPESHARQAGAESNMLTCTIKRGDLSNYDWDVRLASIVTQVKNVITALQDARCSGATLKVSVDRLNS